MQSTDPYAQPPHFAHDEFSKLDATLQAQLVRRGDVRADELLQATFARISAVNPRLNAIAHLEEEAAVASRPAFPAQGVLAGIPTLIKDVLPYPGLPIGYGSRGLGRQVSPSGSEYTAALDAAGLRVIGKSTTSELGLLGTTESLAYGPTRNPWDLRKSTGGSSGGAVAAVASGMVPVAHASDGGGSIRGPAAFTGVFGFKPSRGATKAAGIPADAPLAFMLSDHCVSRSVRDSAAWLDATWLGPCRDFAGLALRKQPLERLRIGAYSRDSLGREPSADVRQAFDKAVKLCESLGHEVVPMWAPEYDFLRTGKAFFTLSAATVGGLFQMLRGVMGPGFTPEAFEPYTQALGKRAEGLTAEDVGEARQQIQESIASAQLSFRGVDVLLCPTTPFTAPEIGRFGPGQPAELLDASIERLASYTALASMAGWCAMSVPLFRSEADGMPVGIHFAAPSGKDDRLFRLAFELEASMPWAAWQWSTVP